jgi:Zn-dependent protease with chaperone function
MAREEVQALVFGPGLSPGGAAASLSISALGVEVSVGARSQRAPLAEISLRAVGFGKPGVEISWKDAGETWAAHVLDPVVAQRLLSSPMLAGTAQANNLRIARRRGTVGRSLGWSLLALFVLLPGVLLVMLVLNASAIASWVADKIPIDQEVSMGREAFADMRGSLKIKDEGPAYDAVKSIVTQLTQESRYQYDVHVSEDDTLNAFAMPGGVIVVHTGLIAATKRPEELAGVLAHEVQHVEQRHSLRGMVKDLGLRGLWSFATGDLGGTLAGQAALEITSLKFSRDDESEADQKGFDALVKANIDPAGMPAFFKTMSEQAADAPAAFLSTHPLSADRERELQQRLRSVDRSGLKSLPFSLWPPAK